MSDTTILEMKHVTKRFPGVVALDDVSIDLRVGEIMGICGENGAGKSTLMRVLSGSYSSREYEGEIWVDGLQQDFTSVSVAKELGIEMVYQELNMMLDATVAENTFVGNLPGKKFVDFKKLYADTQEILDRIGMQISPKAVVRGLNSGQMQMLSIMRALANNPRIIVLDEPTSALTDQETNLMMDFLRDLREKGVSCLFITHKIEEIFRICDRVTVMRDGKVISTRAIEDCTYDSIVEEMIGRKMENMFPKIKADIGKTVLRIENLSIPHPSIKQKRIIDSISFEVHRGEILGIGGLVGAGRSEILGAVFGQLTAGVEKNVYIDGKEVNIASPKDAVSYGMGFLTEERKRSGYIGIMSVLYNLTLVALRNLPHRYFVDRKSERVTAQTVFDRLRIKSPSLDTVILNLSGGNQQKVVLGKWLLKNPNILLIDEPTKGIDVGSKAEIYNIMNELTAAGVSIIMVSSDMPELVSMSDRCLVIGNGMITGEFVGDQITQENVLRAAIAKEPVRLHEQHSAAGKLSQ